MTPGNENSSLGSKPPSELSDEAAGTTANRGYVRSMHPAAYRSGEWAEIVIAGSRGYDDRPTWLVKFPDGATDVWVADDLDGQYEFAAFMADL